MKPELYRALKYVASFPIDKGKYLTLYTDECQEILDELEEK